MSSRKRFAKHVYRDIIMRQNFICGCGCGEIILAGERVDYDHVLALHLGGEDHPDNLRAVKQAHHKRITQRQAKDRGKVRRLVVKRHLKTSERSAKARRLAKIREWERMP